VPANALIDTGTEKVVFLAQGDGYFTPRRITVGRNLGDRVEVLDGLTEGEQVATGATFFLDSESQIRAALENFAPPMAAPASPSEGRASSLDISFGTRPDPPKAGESEFEVVVKTANGQPVTDADVSVQLFMPAMPSMNMPAMRNDAKLLHAGEGIYRGRGQVLVAGRWDVTVVVARDGRAVGRKQLSLSAR
jgi:hypothetical protein